MGLAMIGYSFGTAVGLPIGGVLSGTLGWKAPSVFALCLIGVDFCLRVMVLEKHEVKRWTTTPQDPLQLEPTKSRDPVEAAGETIAIVPNDPHVGDLPKSDADVEATDPAEKAMTQDKAQVKAAQPQYDSLKAIAYLLFHGRPLTGIAISFLNGFLVSGMYNTALVLRLYQRYGLDELHAGYVFFAVAVPAAITSPFAGYLCDRIGPRPLSMLCCSAFAPVLLLLIIEQLPLAAFAVILCCSGMCSGLINAVSNNAERDTTSPLLMLSLQPVMVLFGYIAANSDGVVGSKLS
jgi:MFS family permease